jgi:hypothetical protein
VGRTGRNGPTAEEFSTGFEKFCLIRLPYG